MSLLLPPQSDQEVLLSTHYAYLVCFALNGPPEVYPDFFRELTYCDGWLNYVPGVWIVLTKLTLVSLTARLRPKIRTTDRLMVMPAKGPVDGWLPKDAWVWINKHVPKEW